MTKDGAQVIARGTHEERNSRLITLNMVCDVQKETCYAGRSALDRLEEIKQNCSPKIPKSKLKESDIPAQNNTSTTKNVNNNFGKNKSGGQEEW